LYFLVFSKIYRDPKDDPLLTEEEREDISPAVISSEVHTTPSSLGYLLKQPKVLGLSIGFGAYNYVFYLLLTWLPSYLSTALHVDLLHSFLYTSVPWLVATVTDFAAGWGADALIQRGWNASKVRKAILIVGTAFGLGIVGAARAHTPAEALLWISMSIGGLSAAAPVGWSIPSMIAPHGRVGTVGGIVNLSNQISGIAAPIITGLVVSATHAFTWAFIIPAIYLLIGIAAYTFMLGQIERIPAEASTRT
jgi:MFS transporter, ACS family, D-galactonate transporter